MREYFSQFGDVAEVMVMKDPATRRSRGFVFITFCTPHRYLLQSGTDASALKKRRRFQAGVTKILRLSDDTCNACSDAKPPGTAIFRADPESDPFFCSVRAEI